MIGVGDRLGPYRLLASLGTGGMGEVYRALDERLGREVALKILGARVRSTPDALDRFEREARVIAALSHPNIVVLHDVGRHEDTPYVVMELVTGVTLRVRLAQRPLPVHPALVIAIQTARALAAAHEKGIIHRDLKPENIMVTPDDTVKVLDFGLARMSVPTATGLTARVTEPGIVLGTIGYSAPEQLRGETADHRADIFSFGVMLQEMLTGRTAFSRPATVDVIAAILGGQPDPLPTAVPPALAAVIRRCLPARPEMRFQSARELAGALETVELGGAPAGSAAHQAWTDRRLSVALMPFADLSPDRDQEHVSEGITEELMTAFGRIPGLDFVAGSASRQFKGQVPDPREVGRLLNVTTVLEGSVRRSGDNLRVSVHLVDAIAGRQLWSDRFDGEMADVFALQDTLAAAVAGRLRVRLQAHEKEAEAHRTKNVHAYTLWLQGRHHWNRRTETGLKDSVEFFRRALALDPAYAQAHAGLADAFVMLGVYGALPPAAAMEDARAAADAAIRLDPTLPEPHAAAASVKAVYDWAWADAEREFRAALDLDYGHARVHQWYGIHHLVPQGRFGEAAREAEAALAIEPQSPVVNLTAGLVSFFAGNHLQACEALRLTITMDPSFAMAHFFMGQVYAAMGDREAALQELETTSDLAGGSPEVLAAFGSALALAGHTERAREALGQLRLVAEQRYISPCLLSQMHLNLNDIPSALASLFQAEACRAADLVWLAVHPVFRPLHADPSFLALVERIGLGRTALLPPVRNPVRQG